MTEAAIRDGAIPRAALSDRQVAREISPAAVRLFLAIAEHWRLSVDDARTLLGGISSRTYRRWRRGETGVLTHDRLERISLVLGIYKGLKLLFVDEADGLRWLTAPNRDLPFGGNSPLGHMLGGSIDDLYAVRRYIDAWHGLD